MPMDFNQRHRTKFCFYLCLVLLMSIVVANENREGHSEHNTYNTYDNTDDTPICGGFLEFDATISPEIKKSLDYSSIIVQTFTLDMILKEQTNLAASGYYFLPIYENESFILKISGPHGMNFEPEQYLFTVDEQKNVADFCKADINFKFRGFIVEGQVSTFGTDDGPEGIDLVLFDEKEQKIQTTKTVERGLFKFKPVNPGVYTIKPHEEPHKFDANHSEFKFNVKIDQSNFLPRALVIRGFKVSGRVLADNEPLSRTMVLIYSFNSTLVNNYHCEETLDENFKIQEFKGIAPFCMVYTDKKGEFAFKNIPFGKFLVRPLYKNNFVTFDTEPEAEVVAVEHRDFHIAQDFLVTHFSIYGRVVNSKGAGIPNVTIKIDGQDRAVSDNNGIYILQNLTPGNYDVEAQADDMFFEPLTNIRITAHLESLPELSVTDYKLCGKIVIEAKDFYPTSKRAVVLQDRSDKSSSKKERRTITDSKGKYCFEVKPGKYFIHPVLTQDEKESDLHLQPDNYELEVVDRPLLDVNFYQSKVQVSGKIHCLKECEKNVSVKLVSSKNDRTLSATTNENNEFEFKNILSGQYKLVVVKPEWCWNEEEVTIKVQNSDINNIQFTQSGYSLFYSSGHNIDIEWENLSTHEKKQTTLEKNKSKICLPLEGEYKVTPKSCYKFTHSDFYYTTGKSSSLELTPIEYLTKGSIEVEPDLLNTSIKVDIAVNEKIGSTLVEYKNFSLNTNGSALTPLEFYTKPDSVFIVTPSIPGRKSLLFLPKERELVVKQACSTDALTFVMKTGLIIEGRVSPPMEGVVMTAINKATKVPVASTLTDPNGVYSIGPLYKENSYEIKAAKEGYKIVAEKNNDFNAEKLSFLRVKIVDVNKKPLQSVFLSLSSADRGFRVNSNTNAEGFFDFTELYSGEYYIKPLFKEYRFEPAQVLVKILGGQHYEETLVAHRIAFSIYGKINNLNKEKVEGLFIQAIDEKSKQIQETNIDRNGEYRLKGLNPGNVYTIKVKIPAHSSIEKALPSNVPVTLKKEDVTGVDFVVLQRPKKIDVRGYLNFTQEEDKCPFEKAQNVYVELVKMDDEDEGVKTQKVNNACQFVYRGLEKKRYSVKLFEKQGKMNPSPKLLLEQTIDLSDEREINGGVKILVLEVERVKRNAGENLNYTMYSPIFLFAMVFSILKYDYAKWVFNMLLFPFNVLGNVFSSGKRK